MNNGLTTACLVLLNQLKQSVQKHPKRITAAVATLLLTGGGGAFAVASFAPDPADLPVRTVTQAVQSLAADEPLSSLVDIPQYALYRSDVTRSADTAESILQRLGVADPAASAFLRSDANVRQNLLGRTGRSMSAETTDDHRLTRLTARWAPDDSESFKRLVVERQQDGSFASRIETAPLTVGSRLAGGIIRSSLFAATDAANIPDAVAVQLAEVFSGDIDFRRALRKEDRFSVVYETLEADGEPLRSGRVLSAEFHNGDKTHSAVWFQEPGATKGSYYTLDGESMRRAYLSSPVEFSRVSSGFAMRFHPIHKTWRAHLGTDFAAPTGTSVRTVGDGVVDFAGVQNGYGNVVHIKHRNQHAPALRIPRRGRAQGPDGYCAPERGSPAGLGRRTSGIRPPGRQHARAAVLRRTDPASQRRVTPFAHGYAATVVHRADVGHVAGRRGWCARAFFRPKMRCSPACISATSS